MPSLMKERPLLMSGAMVRAILEGRKTQTRRVVKPQPIGEHGCWMWAKGKHQRFGVMGVPVPPEVLTLCPYGQPGDRIWVRETWAVNPYTPEVRYRATDELWTDAGPLCWRPSIHMPRDCCRIRLEIVSVRVERLNDISEADARAEGIIDGGCLNCGNSEPCGCADPRPDARDSFIRLWESINGTGSWHANPWVWVVEFKRVTT